MNAKKFALIGSFSNYNNAKVHISKDNLDVDSYCGTLGIQYSFISNTGFQYDDTKMFSTHEIFEIEKICKKCLTAFKKENYVSPTI